MRAYEEVEVSSASELRTWLEAHHAQPDGVWLVTWKKAYAERYVGYEALVRELLCFGWIDGVARGVDEQRSSLYVAPRRARSAWSRPNKQRVAELIEAGLMRPPGLTVLEVAQLSGTWSALDDVENLVEPDDLRAALDARPAARQHWDAFPRSARRAVLEWVGSAKRPDTRERRIAETVELAAENIRARAQPERARPPR